VNVVIHCDTFLYKEQFSPHFRSRQDYY